MGTNFDRATDRTGGRQETYREEADERSDEPPRRDAAAAWRSFKADERTVRSGREAERERSGNHWNAVVLVTSLGATCLFGVGGLLARSAHLTTAASVMFVAVSVLLVQRGRHWLG